MQRHDPIRISYLILISLSGVSLSGMASAEQPSRPSRIAVIDVGYIFKHSSTFKQEIGVLEAQAKKDREYRLDQQKQMVEIANRLRTQKGSSAEHRMLEERLAMMESDAKLELHRRRKTLADAEANLYFRHYMQVRALVRDIAAKQGFDVVLKFDGRPSDPSKPQSVMRDVMNTIVYRRSEIDLTQTTLEQMERTAIAQKGLKSIK